MLEAGQNFLSLKCSCNQRRRCKILAISLSHWKGRGGGQGGQGFKWSGCIVRIRLWLRLPHSCHRLLSIVPASRASASAIGLCIPALAPRCSLALWTLAPRCSLALWTLAPRCSLALWTLPGHAYIQVSGHSLPQVLLLAPFGPSRFG